MIKKGKQSPDSIPYVPELLCHFVYNNNNSNRQQMIKENERRRSTEFFHMRCCKWADYKRACASL